MKKSCLEKLKARNGLASIVKIISQYQQDDLRTTCTCTSISKIGKLVSFALPVRFLIRTRRPTL